MKELPAFQADRVLEPGPIVMVSPSDNGKPNVMTMRFHMMIQHEPPLIGCVIGPWDHSYQALYRALFARGIAGTAGSPGDGSSRASGHAQTDAWRTYWRTSRQT
jgi:hypothetical protein